MINEKDRNLDNLNNIIEQSREKLSVLKEILNVSLKIKDEAEKFRADFEDENAVDNIVSLTDLREELVNKIKNTDLALKHYYHKLNEEDIKIYNKIKKSVSENQKISKSASASASESAERQAYELYKILSEIKIVLDGIKSADEMNSERIIALTENIKAKIKIVKDNRTLMGKFVGDDDSFSAGTLLSEKK